MPSAWGHTRLLETDWLLITKNPIALAVGVSMILRLHLQPSSA